MDLVVDFRFSAAHRLPRHPGRCFRMHGHDYRLEVVVSGAPEGRSGRVIDFFVVERVVKPIVAELHNSCLNDCLENPTAEAIVVWIWRALCSSLPSLTELRLWETEQCHVAYRGEIVDAALLTPGEPGPHPSTAAGDDADV